MSEHPVAALLDELVAADIAAGLTRGMQVFVAVRGKTLAHKAYGVRGQDDETVDVDLPFALFSTSKPLTATALHVLVHQGQLRYDDSVAAFLPEFAAHGKGGVLVRHLLTHQAGIPDPTYEVAVATYADFPQAIAQICALVPSIPPGDVAFYHALTGAAVIAEVVQRVSGQDFRTFCSEQVLQPLGMSRTTFGVPAGVEVSDTVGMAPDRIEGCDLWRSASVKAALHPAIGAYAPAHDVARLLQMYLDDGAGLISPELARQAVSVQTGGAVGFGYGFMVGVDPAKPGSRGSRCSARTFGHPGMCSTQAMADPATGLVLVLLANGDPGQDVSDARFARLCDAIVAATAG